MLLMPFNPDEIKSVKQGYKLRDSIRQSYIEDAFKELHSTDIRKVASYLNKNSDYGIAAKAFQNKEVVIDDFCLLNSKGEQLLDEDTVDGLWDYIWHTLLWDERKVELKATFQQPDEALLKMAINSGYDEDYSYDDSDNSDNANIIDDIFDNRLDELVNDYMFPDLNIEFYGVKKESLGSFNSSNLFDSSPYLLNARAHFTFTPEVVGNEVKEQDEIYSGFASEASFRAKFIK